MKGSVERNTTTQANFGLYTIQKSSKSRSSEPVASLAPILDVWFSFESCMTPCETEISCLYCIISWQSLGGSKPYNQSCCSHRLTIPGAVMSLKAHRQTGASRTKGILSQSNGCPARITAPRSASNVLSQKVEMWARGKVIWFVGKKGKSIDQCPRTLLVQTHELQKYVNRLPIQLNQPWFFRIVLKMYKKESHFKGQINLQNVTGSPRNTSQNPGSGASKSLLETWIMFLKMICYPESQWIVTGFWENQSHLRRRFGLQKLIAFLGSFAGLIWPWPDF